MAVRGDITVNWDLSPRLITVAAPSTEVTIQDLHDTLRSLEDDLLNLDNPQLVSTAGKEDLGGGVNVGLTMTLDNAHVAFEERRTSVSSGTATTANSAGTTLIDSAATFITDGITAGASVINETDRSAGTVLSVDSETQLTLTGLADGTDDDFDVSDVYKVWNEIQCNVDGGNLVAIDTTGAAISPVFPTFGTQIVRTSSSSATALQQLDIEHSSFNGGVTIDTASAFSGTTFPTGTPRQPVNNLADALTIATDRGLTSLLPISNITLNSGTFDNLRIVGLGKKETTVVVNAGASVVGTTFIDVNVSGTMDGNIQIIDCTVGNITGVNGLIETSGLDGTITLSGNLAMAIIDCHDAVAGVGVPTVNMGSGQGLIVRRYSGGIQITNKSGADEASIEVAPGRIILTSTVTSGAIIVRGVGSLEDSSSGATITKIDMLNPATAATTLLDLTDGVEVGLTPREALRLISAVLGGDILAPGGPGDSDFQAAGNSGTVRVVSVADENGDRVITLTL